MGDCSSQFTGANSRSQLSLLHALFMRRCSRSMVGAYFSVRSELFTLSWSCSNNHDSCGISCAALFLFIYSCLIHSACAFARVQLLLLNSRCSNCQCSTVVALWFIANTSFLVFLLVDSTYTHRVCLPTELDLEAISNMRMLQRMSVLEEKGAEFSHMQLKAIKFMGESHF